MFILSRLHLVVVMIGAAGIFSLEKESRYTYSQVMFIVVWVQQARDPLRVLITALNTAGNLILPDEHEQVLQILICICIYPLITTKIDMPNLVTDLNWTLIFEWSGVAPRTNTNKTNTNNRYWTMCLKYHNHSKLNSQHNRGNLYDHFMSKRIFTLIMYKMFRRSPKIMRKVATVSIWIC